MIDKLRAYCHKWHGDLLVLSGIEFDRLPFPDYLGQYDSGWHEAPFTDGMGIHWPSRRVFVKESHTKYTTDIIHEMGHLFACRWNPNGPIEEHEFLGWEIRLALLVGLPDSEYKRQNSNYVVDAPITDGYASIKDLSRAEWIKAKRNAIAFSKAKGLLDRNLTPICIRRTRCSL